VSEREDLKVESREAVAWITLDRPDARNAYSEGMIRSLVGALDEIANDPNIRVAVITGAGTAFSAGGDLKAMRERTGMFEGNPVELRTRYTTGIQSIPRAIARFEKPLIAAINGPAIGAGLDLACMCDLRISSEAGAFGSTFTRVGLVPGDGGAYFLAQAVGFPRALEMILTAKILDSAHALAIGLVHECVPHEMLNERVTIVAQSIAANAPWAVRLAKRAAYRSRNVDLDTALELAAAYQGLVQPTQEHQEAVSALLEGRPAVFKPTL
jgi:enoyl-CoA hydratase/carnithine racemase